MSSSLISNGMGFEIVKISDNKKWMLIKLENKYVPTRVPEKENERAMVFTPDGNLLLSDYKVIGERMLKDLEFYGPEYMLSDSILPWQYTYIDSFSKISHEAIEDSLIKCFLKGKDWTTEGRIMDEKFTSLFGNARTRKAEIKKWLAKCTPMQLTAVCCIGNAYESINVAYVLGMLMENFKDEELIEQFNILAEFIGKANGYLESDWVTYDFKTFDMYYGIHLAENGPIINKKMDKLDMN